MKWLKKNSINIILIYINILFIALVIFDAYQLINTDLPYIFLIITGGMVTYCIFNLILSRAKNKKLVILLFFVLLIFLTLFFKRNIGELIYNEIIKEIDTINNLLVEHKPVDFVHFKGIFALYIPIIVILVMYLSTVGRLDYILLLNLGIITFLWVLGYRATVEKITLPFIVLVGLTLGVNNHNRFMKKVGEVRIRHGVRPIRIVLPLLLITVISAFITSYIPYREQGKYYMDFIEYFKELFISSNASEGEGSDGRRFTLKASGYNDSGTTLGGSITINHDEVLEVRSEKPLYLKGSSKDTYNGKTWGGTLTSGMKKNYFDIDNNVSELDISNRVAANTYRISIKPLVSYRNLFIPNNTAFIESDRTIYVNDRTKTAYFNSFNMDEYVVEYNEYEMPDNSMDEKSGYYQQIVDSTYHRELQLYEGITERTRNLVEELTEGASSDIEVVDRIEGYISDNYTYSLNVSPIPEKQDFVDYYLFDSPSGYCVYSASAITIMLRIAGIPTRYVEGFKTSEGSYEEGIYTITNADAHAWTEAYIYDGEGYRWITVDASTTPAELEENQEDNEVDSDNTTSPGTPQGNGNNTHNDGPTVDSGIENPAVEEDLQDKTEGRSIPSLAIYTLSAAVVIWLLGRAAYKVINRLYIVNSGSNKALYGYFVRRLKRHGYNKDNSLTDREFVQTIDDRGLNEAMSKLLHMVYEEHYGGIFTKSNNKRLYKEIESSIRRIYHKSFKYYLFKYLL